MALFEIKMTEKEIVDGLRSNYGKEFTAPDVRGFCAANDIAYQTVTTSFYRRFFLCIIGLSKQITHV